VAAVLLAIPTVIDTRLPVFITALAMATIFTSLGLLVGTSGQVSLCHGAFAAVGAATFSHLQSAGLPWLLALLAAGLATVPVGALIALPAIRLSGIYLALATFGFALLAEKLLFSMSFLFGAIGSRDALRPNGLGLNLTSDRSFYYVALGALAVAVAVVALVRASRLGRMLRGLADSPVALSHHGADVNMIRIVVFCLSAAIAGVGGALLANASGFATSGSFAAVTSLIWITVLVISGSGGGMSAVVAAALLVVAPEYLGDGFQEWQTALFGLAAVILCLRRPSAVDLRSAVTTALTEASQASRRFPVRTPAGTADNP
jgi:ABC-type branched-subunit amino acid transport system permease subunit